jgi:hypothetical protein
MLTKVFRFYSDKIEQVFIPKQPSSSSSRTPAIEQACDKTITSRNSNALATLPTPISKTPSQQTVPNSKNSKFPPKTSITEDIRRFMNCSTKEHRIMAGYLKLKEANKTVVLLKCQHSVQSNLKPELLRPLC